MEEYLRHGAEHVHIYAFEPNDKALLKLRSRVSRLINEYMLGDGDIVIVPAGLSSETKQLRFMSKRNQSMLIPDELGEMELPVYSLDDFFTGKKPFTLLKSDIEGGEMDMLRGAKSIITQHCPKMALSIYHSAEDFVDIAEYVHALVPEYKMAVRNHGADYKGTVLYCWK